MELKIKVNAISIKDENTGEAYTLKTVRTVKEIYEDVQAEEKEALLNKMYDLTAQY